MPRPKPDTLARELERLWIKEAPAPPLPLGKQKPRTELDDRIDEWLTDFLGGEHGTGKPARP